MVAAIASLQVLVHAGSAFSEQYLCVPDKATGFTYDKAKKEWDYAVLKTDHQYVIEPPKDGKYYYTLTKVGEKEPDGYCEDDFNSSGYLFCDLVGGTLKFNKRNFRYLIEISFGYYNVLTDEDEDSGTPMLEIGKCSPF